MRFAALLLLTTAMAAFGQQSLYIYVQDKPGGAWKYSRVVLDGASLTPATGKPCSGTEPCFKLSWPVAPAPPPGTAVAPAVVTSVACGPAAVADGEPVSCTIQLGSPAPSAGYQVPVLYGIAIHGAPTQFVVPPGQTQATIQFPAPPLPTWPGTTPDAAWNSDIERAMFPGSGFYGPIGGDSLDQNGKSRFFAFVSAPLDGIPSKFILIAGSKIYFPAGR